MYTLFKAFPDMQIIPARADSSVNYIYQFGSGNTVCSVSELVGTHTGPLDLGNGRVIPPTGKKIHVLFCTVANFVDGRVNKEYLFWDQLLLLQQLGVVNVKSVPASSLKK
ncbi:ester cyclase [Pedobacter lusitanus]|uniref:ester cyclase n=1 Tax=Pedobacter lusitanus TaxID=1503925 RepID=UPI000697CBE1|nr:ester cyclase [Pedobacter lusitanus]